MSELQELPDLRGLTALKTLHKHIRNCPELRNLPERIVELTALKNLRIYYSSSKSDRHPLSGDGATNDTDIGDGGMLVFNPLVVIGRTLKAWPLPLVISLEISIGSVYSTGRSHPLVHSKKSPDTALNKCWQTLGLPAEAASWGSMKILDFFRVHRTR
jgi:hypothetical protein